VLVSMRRLGGLKKGGGMNEPVSGGLGGMELLISLIRGAGGGVYIYYP
jgi:hypothetical protein